MSYGVRAGNNKHKGVFNVKALVYEGPGQKEWKEAPNPQIQHPTDVIVKMEATTICGTDTVNSSDADWQDKVKALTDGLGVEVAIEAVGIPATFTGATQILRPGGTVANVGVHGEPVELAINDLWISDVTITMGLVSTSTLGMLVKLVAEKKLPAEKFVTHEFTFDEILNAHEVFGNAAKENALNVLIRN